MSAWPLAVARNQELLFDHDYANDMRGVGCILAGLLLGRELFRRFRDNQRLIGKYLIAKLGTGDVLSHTTKYMIDLTQAIRKVMVKYVIRGGPKKARADIPVSADSQNLVTRDWSRWAIC